MAQQAMPAGVQEMVQRAAIHSAFVGGVSVAAAESRKHFCFHKK